MGPRKRGRPPKRPVEPEFEGVPEAVVEESAAESVTGGELRPDEVAAKAVEPEAEAKQQDGAPQNAGSEEHTCSECGMSFQRRYSLIMHTLKHEKARAYKCSVSVDENRSISVDQRLLIANRGTYFCLF